MMDPISETALPTKGDTGILAFRDQRLNNGFRPAAPDISHSRTPFRKDQIRIILSDVNFVKKKGGSSEFQNLSFSPVAAELSCGDFASVHGNPSRCSKSAVGFQQPFTNRHSFTTVSIRANS